MDIDMTQIEDVIQTIEAVKGKDYTQVVVHTVNVQRLLCTIPDTALADKVAYVCATLLTGLGRQCGVDINDPLIGVELSKNCDVVRNALNLVRPPQS